MPLASLTVKAGVVSGGGRSVSYGQLVGGKLLNITGANVALQPGVAPAKPPKTSELASLPQQTDTVTIAGTQTTETGPLVSALMTLAGVQYNAQSSNDELRYWVEATSANGQAVEVSAGELDPFYGNRPAILSIDQNGTFLTSSGPRLIVPNDATDARDIEHVTRITIGRAPVELADTATPACGTAGQMPDPAPGTVVINGDVANPMTLTMAQLQSLPQVSQTDTFLSGSRSSTNSESGPALYSILEAAQPKFLACDPNDKRRFSVEVTSSEDGFAGIFSWAEIDPQLDNVPALLSLVNNGVPVLQTDSGPALDGPGRRSRRALHLRCRRADGAPRADRGANPELSGRREAVGASERRGFRPCLFGGGSAKRRLARTLRNGCPQPGRRRSGSCAPLARCHHRRGGRKAADQPCPSRSR